MTYLQTCEPNELVHISGSHYSTREHDSPKISNGKWYWFSRGFGGYNALDYLIKVKEVPFMEAVERITGQVAYQPRQSQPKPEKPKVLLWMVSSTTAPQRTITKCREGFFSYVLVYLNGVTVTVIRPFLGLRVLPLNDKSDIRHNYTPRSFSRNCCSSP